MDSIERLFARMEALYGNRFLEMWSRSDMAEVKRVWADEMGKFSAMNLRKGFRALIDRTFPPTLPEFLADCKPLPRTAAYHDLLPPPADVSPQARENATKMIAELSAVGILAPKEDHRRWIQKILYRQKWGDKTLPYIAVKMAHEALAVMP